MRSTAPQLSPSTSRALYRPVAAVIVDPDLLTRAAAAAALVSFCGGCGGCAIDLRGQRGADLQRRHAPSAPGSCPEVSGCPWCGPLALIGVHGMAAVAECPARRPLSPATAPTLTAVRLVYVLRDHLAAQLHLLHGCADAVAVLSTCGGGPRLELLEDAGPLAAAGLTVREVDVLALLLARAANDEIAARLVISPATVRAHCRAVLRKLGVARRQDLWRTFERRPA